MYQGKDIGQLLDKIVEFGRNGLIDEYYDIKSSDPTHDFKSSKWVLQNHLDIYNSKIISTVEYCSGMKYQLHIAEPVLSKDHPRCV